MPASAFVAAVEANLRENWGLEPLRRASQPGDEDSVFLKVDDHNALRFEISPHGGLHNLFLVQTICAFAIITSSILFLSIYAVRWIISPLSSIASAARSFGRAGGDEAELSVDGPREIEQAAQALNDMRKRVRSLVNERTQMLAAISHDLRTPLTRLRLRVERLKDDPPRAAMLQDIATIDEMLGAACFPFPLIARGSPPRRSLALDLDLLDQLLGLGGLRQGDGEDALLEGRRDLARRLVG